MSHEHYEHHDHSSHSHSHAAEGAHDHSAHDHLSPESHDFVAANKTHHNAQGHAHNYGHSALNDWAAGKCAATILASLPFDEDSTTLFDFACGPGLVSQRLAAHCKSILGVDLSQAMVDQFNQQVSDHGIDASEMQAVQKDELLDEDSELGGQLFDVVVCAQTYHHIPDVVGITKALSRRLKPGGRLIVIDLDAESGFGEAITTRISKQKAEELSKVVVHKGGFTRARLQEIFESTDRFSKVTVEVSHSMMLSEMKALKGQNNWAESVTGPDLEIRALVAVGVRKE